ncbi:MAG: hypothetical protein LC808_34185 [Actinobacteria bacterium]|nr:hypothetical protein [Actinomycetota bacterium]
MPVSDHTEPEGGRWRRLVCIGLRLDTRSRLASFFLDDEEGNRYGWRKPVLGPAVPGSQYRRRLRRRGGAHPQFSGGCITHGGC